MAPFSWSSRAAAFTLACLGPLAAQQTIVVQGGGDALQRAVGAAAPGDTLIVRGGTYYSPQIRKGIRMLCDPGVVIDNMVFFTFVVQGVPRGERFVMRGGTIQGAAHIAYECWVTACDGPVQFEDVRITGSENVVSDSRSVMFHRCELANLSVQNSNAAIAECRIGGSSSIRCSLDVGRGETTVSDSTVFLVPSLPLPDRNAIRLGSGRLRLTGGTTVSAAAMSPQPPTVYVASGTLVLDPSTTILSPTGQTIAGPGAVVRQPVPWFDVVGQTAGQPMRVTMNAEPHSLALVLVSLPVEPVPLFGDLYWMSFDAPILFGGTADAQGQLTAQSGIPLVVRDVPLVLQGLSLSPAGALRVGAATPLIFD